MIARLRTSGLSGRGCGRIYLFDRRQCSAAAWAAAAEEVRGKLLHAGATSAEELAKPASDQSWHRPAVVDIARREAEGQELPAVVDDQVELEGVAPADRGIVPARVTCEDAVLADPRGLADAECRRVDETDAGARVHLSVQIDSKRHEHVGMSSTKRV